MPKKTNDIEKRLEALENRQNMFPGGLVGLGNITLPTSYVDPTTGKTIPIPTVPSMGQSNLTTTYNQQQTKTSAGPTSNTTNINSANAGLTGNQLEAAQSDDAVVASQSNVFNQPATFDSSATTYVDPNVTVNADGSKVNTDPVTGQKTFFAADGTITGVEKGGVFTDMTGGTAGTDTLTSAEGANIALQSLRDETGGVEGVTADDIFQKLTDLGYTPNDIHEYITMSAFASNPEGGLYNATQDLLGQFSYDSETGQHTYTAAESNVDFIPFESGTENLQNGNTRVRIKDNNPNSPTFGQYYFETRSPDGTVLFKSKIGTEADARADIQELEQGKNVNPIYREAGRVPNGDGTFTVTYIDTNPNSPTYNETITSIEGNKGNDAGEGGGAGAGGTGVAQPTNYGDVQAQFDQMAGLTGLNPALPPGTNVAPAMDVQPQPSEFETTAGVQLGAAPLVGTQVVSDEQIAALNAAGYTISPLSKQGSNTDTLTPITNQVLTAQTKDTLLREVTGQSGTLSTESVIGTAPQAESIEVKKADAPSTNDVAEVSRRGTPSVDDFVGTYGDKIQAAKRSMDVGDTVPELDPQTANQATAQVQYEKTAEATMQAAQATADERTRTIAQAVEQEMSQVPVEATVQGQLENLMAQFADGKTPAYAAGAIRNAQAQMAARGLSASSMAGAAIMQAAMESSLPIAAQDAQVFREINLSNINNKQKVALANQAAALNLSLADLNNRQQTALQNSTNGYKLQAQSLSNMQQTALANAQLRAALQDRELAFDQQRAITNAAKYTEIENINLSNEQQGIMQDSVNNINFAMSNLSFQQQRRLAKAQVDAALTGQELSVDAQRAVINAARVAEVNNIKFTEEQTRNLNEAQIMQNLTLANLDADMKAALSDAASYATMDMANLNNRQQAQVINAQSFLNLDLTNLSNKQQGEVLKYQARTNALFSDAAADNARNQFNAQSENQVNQFFAQLGAQVAQQNAQRVAAMKQFNVDQVNSHARFNSSLVDNREKFNGTMQAQINQSNAQWRRQTNTVNTATQNEANRIDALNLLNMNQNSLNNLWQAYRDEASWLFTEGMTAKQYAHEIAKMNLNAQQQRALYNLQVKGDTIESIGTVVVDAAFGL